MSLVKVSASDIWADENIYNMLNKVLEVIWDNPGEKGFVQTVNQRRDKVKKNFDSFISKSVISCIEVAALEPEHKMNYFLRTRPLNRYIFVFGLLY